MNWLDGLFDIARSNTLETISIEEDKIFLLQQREMSRPGAMGSTDCSLEEEEK